MPHKPSPPQRPSLLMPTGHFPDAGPGPGEGHSPRVGENAIDSSVSPLAVGVREQKDVLQPVEVLVRGHVAAHQHGLQEGVPLGDRQGTLATLVPLEG